MNNADALREVLDILISIDHRLQVVQETLTAEAARRRQQPEWVQKRPQQPRHAKYLYEEE